MNKELCKKCVAEYAQKERKEWWKWIVEDERLWDGRDTVICPFVDGKISTKEGPPDACLYYLEQKISEKK
jgi:hypothetical protein